MSTHSKKGRRILALVLAFVMAASAITITPSMTAEAASKKVVKSLSGVSGEKTMTVGKTATVKAKVTATKKVEKGDLQVSVKSSNSMVVAAEVTKKPMKKAKTGTTSIELTAKNTGTATITVTTNATNRKNKKISKKIKVTVEDVSSEDSGSQEQSEFAVGETWTVDGQWELTVNSIEETADRNEYSEKNPAAVYIVSYTYKNIGYKDADGIMDGLFLSLDDTIVDCEGSMGYSYPGDVERYPQETPVGANCLAQVCIGVDHAGTPIKLYVTTYDGNDKEQSAIFVVQ